MRHHHFPGKAMCRNIRTLFNFAPPATDDEVRAAARQFVRKLSGYNAPSKANEAAFQHAVEQVTAVARELIDSLVTTAAPRDRQIEAQRAKVRNATPLRATSRNSIFSNLKQWSLLNPTSLLSWSSSLVVRPGIPSHIGEH